MYHFIFIIQGKTINIIPDSLSVMSIKFD